MQWSSKSIGRLAAALAKAQAELKNPEKTLTATIFLERRNDRAAANNAPDSAGRTFHYASLAGGLEIVRQTLSKQGIAIVQTTGSDDGAHLVKLTTVLAHSSGEWIASDWPVCSVKDTETPHRMGTALTYARRYSLFALVGIAGEDDLDAPDLQSPSDRTPAPRNGEGTTANPKQGNGGLNVIHNVPAGKATAMANRASRPASLNPEQSSALRDRLVEEVNAIASADDGALWAYHNLRAKNGLTTADAQAVETAFQAKLSALAAPEGSANMARREPRCSVASSGAPHRTRAPSEKERRHRPAKGRQARIDKTVLAFPEARRIRDREHVRFVAKQPCLVCGRLPSDPHHLRFAQIRALGRKVSDEFTVPLCRGHHREVHRCGDEATWWAAIGIDPAIMARDLWLQTHPQLSATNASAVETSTTTNGRPDTEFPRSRAAQADSERPI